MTDKTGIIKLIFRRRTRLLNDKKIKSKILT